MVSALGSAGFASMKGYDYSVKRAYQPQWRLRDYEGVS